MTILFINNEGGSFADRIPIEEGMTINKLFEQQIGNKNPSNYFIRINRDIVTPGQVLHDNDRVTITPKKIQGA